MNITSSLTNTASFIGFGNRRMTDPFLLPLSVLYIHREEGISAGLTVQTTPPNTSVLAHTHCKGIQTATEGPPSFKRVDLS